MEEDIIYPIINSWNPNDEPERPGVLLQHFSRKILGLDEVSKKIKIKNPQVLRFHFDEKQRDLIARAKDVLVVENIYLGYDVEYDPQKFSID